MRSSELTLPSEASAEKPCLRLPLPCRKHAHMPAERSVRLTAWICSNAGAVVVAAAILSVAAASLAFRLDLHAGLDELLPEDDPATVEIRRVSGRVASLQAL